VSGAACALFFLYAATASADSLRDGLLALDRGDLATARLSLEEASKTTPADGRVWIALAQVYWRQHDGSAAGAAASKAAALSPDEPAVLQGLAIYYAETGQNLKAARAQAKFAAKVPANAAARARAEDLYFQAAQPLLERQQFTDAKAALDEAVAFAPRNAQLQLALGVAAYGLRRFNDAADAFLRTIEIAPSLEQPYMFLDKIIDQIPARLPQVTQRAAAYAAANPASATGYLLHAKALDAQSKEPEAALNLLQKSVAIDSTNSAAHFEMGTVLDRLERYPEAASAFARAAELAPNDAAAHYRLARDYERLGKREAAQAEREKHAQLIKAQEAIR
jgi:tetratricopeptide (TPR) repeat protein